MINRFKRLATGVNSVRGASIIMVGTLLASNLLGLVRDHLLAQKIPTTLLDTYYAAFGIPDFLFNVLILGAVSAAFIPLLSKYFHDDEREAWHVADTIVTIGVLAITVMAVVMVLLLPLLIPLFVPNFSPEKLALTISLSRWLMIQPVLFGASYLLSSILAARKRFVVAALAPVLYNLSIIGATYFFADRFDVRAVIIGVIIGAVLHVSMQIAAAKAIGYQWKPQFDVKHPAIKNIALLMVPRSIGLGGTQIVLLVFIALASSLSAGSVAIYTLADNIRTMPLAVFAISFATAVFPTLSDAHSTHDEPQFSSYIVHGLRSIAFLNIPSAVGLLLLRAQIVRLVLGSGFFNWEATVAAAATLGFFAFGLIGEGFTQILARALYAQHNTKSPTIISLGSNAIMVVCGLVFSRLFGVAGLAIGFSIGALIQATWLYLRLRKELPSLRKRESELLQFAWQLLVALAALALAVQATKWVTVAIGIDLEHGWGVLVQTIAAIVIGSTAYFVTAHWLHIPEIADAQRIFSRLTRKGITSIEE